MDKKIKSIGKNAAILGIAGIIVKILGALYRIPIVGLIGDEGLGYYQTAYPIYDMMLAVSTAGLPIAISKMVAESVAKESYLNSKKILRLAIYLMGAVGIVFGFLIYIFANRLAIFYKNPGAYYSIIALVPAMAISPVLAGMRGYYQGRQIMAPTAMSQVLVQLFRLISGLVLAGVLVPYGLNLAAGGATLASGVGALFGLLYIVLYHFRFRKYLNDELITGNQNTEKSSVIIKEMIKIALPISIGAAIIPIMDSIDVYLVMDGLIDVGFTPEEANLRFAWLKGMAQTLINMPQVISGAIGVSLIPVIAMLKVKNNQEEISEKVKVGIKLTMLFALPCMFGLFSLSHPIISLIYPTTSDMAINGTSVILKILSFSVVPLMLITVTTSLMQAFGKEKLPVINLIVGAIFKIILTIYLTRVPHINVYGAAIGSVVGYLVTIVLNIIAIKKLSGYKTDKSILIFLIASIIMGACAYGTQMFLGNITSSKLATLIAILVAAVVYFGILILTHSISKKDLEMLRNK